MTQKKAKKPSEKRSIGTQSNLSNVEMAKRIERNQLDDLLRRQKRGQKLTGADYAFIEGIKRQADAKTKNVTPLKKESRPEWLERMDLKGREKMEQEVDTAHGMALVMLLKEIANERRKAGMQETTVTDIQLIEIDVEDGKIVKVGEKGFQPKPPGAPDDSGSKAASS